MMRAAARLISRGKVLGAIVRLADAIGVERVRRKDLRARFDEPLANAAHNVRLRDVEKVVVALLVLQQVEAGTISVSRQLFGLDAGSVGAVLDEDALGGFGAE